MGSQDHPASCIDTNTCDSPMLWIGFYIAIASIICTLAMLADLLHGFQTKKLWFPCKYFSLNAAFITVISVAMKLPIDLSTVMPNYVDQGAKVGSLGFMCVMMANLMPSLASMDNKTLLTNMVGLCIFVVTMIVNICIQLKTGAITEGSGDYYEFSKFHFVIFAYIYTVMIFLLLIIMISSSLTIPTSKDTLESKYQATNKMSLTRQMSKVEKLKQHVRKYWVMAETGSPQFGMASNPLSTASGVICVIVLGMNLLMLIDIFFQRKEQRYGNKFKGESSYWWSTSLIFITQSTGVLVGSIAPISRCFSFFSFKWNTYKWNRRYFMFHKVEDYWIQKLNEWKQSAIPFQSSSLKSSLVYNSKNIILSLCIGLQTVIVISCKVIWVIVTVVSIFVVTCFTTPDPSRTDDIDEDLSSYAIQIDNETELAEKTLKRISKSMDSFLSKAEKKQNDNLLELLKKSTGFKGVEIFDTINNVKLLHSCEFVNSWSLPIVTLTCIAVALPNICKHIIESLLRSVGEGLSFTHLVEENLNNANEYANIRKTTMILWHEVENKRKWLDNPLAKIVCKETEATEIVKSFSDKAKEIVRDINGSSNKGQVENPPHMLIAANSMYRVTQTILLRFQNSETIINKQLFAHLNGMIADIFSACFTNIPRVITMRCRESVIEKREASVTDATKLLGKTTKIIERLETLELPLMDDDKMAYIDEWRLHLKQTIPQGQSIELP